MKVLRHSFSRDDQSRLILAFEIVALYFLIVVGVVGAIVYFNPPLYRGEWYAWPTGLMLLIWFLYYGAPLILASIFGFLFKPFAKSFRNIFFAILIIQLFFSFILMTLRWDYLQNFNNKNRWKKSDRISIEKITPRQFDRNQDGYIEEIRLDVVFDFTRLRPSDYLLHAAIVPGGSVSAFIVDGGGEFSIVKTGGENKFEREFIVAPRTDLGPLPIGLQNFQLKFLLFRIVMIDEYGKNILAFTRWSPFLRSTHWDGSDPEIYEDWRPLDNKITPDVFSMRAPVLPQK